MFCDLELKINKSSFITTCTCNVCNLNYYDDNNWEFVKYIGNDTYSVEYNENEMKIYKLSVHEDIGLSSPEDIELYCGKKLDITPYNFKQKLSMIKTFQ
jgi:hypothetical protein